MIPTMTWIYGGLKYLSQCNACLEYWMDDILKSGIFCLWEKSFREQRWGKKCPLIIWNSSSHRFIKHSGVAIMLCCVSSIICQQTVFGYEPLSLSAHITHFLSSLWVWAALCSSLFATNLSIITQLPWSFDSHVSPWISYFIQQQYKNRIKI